MGHHFHVWLRDVYVTSFFHFINHVCHALVCKELDASFAHARRSLNHTVRGELFGDNVFVCSYDPTKAVDQIV